MRSTVSHKRLSTLSRREFLWLSSMTAAGAAIGCATNPVSGRSQLMLMSEAEEIELDRKHSPIQFSADYGVTQDEALNAYLGDVGMAMADKTHRPQMPYRFEVVNANYVNAYAFPGGSIATTRGILLELDNEGELAGLLGHELGHVNARHTAQQMTKGTLTQAVISGVAMAVGTQGRIYGDLVSGIGMVGAGALLASYSRDNEREADDLGMRYTIASGYSPDGFIGLMDMLNRMSHGNRSAFELLFATHPMSDERYQTALAQARDFERAKNKPVYRERYMDMTAGLRKIKGAIQDMQKGEAAMGKKAYSQAEGHFETALKQAPDDYTALILMAKCQTAMKDFEAADRYTQKAKQVYPKEAQAHYLSGFAKLQTKQYEAAYEAFSAYDRLLPGNPNITFFKGYALEGVGKKEAAAQDYYRYLQVVNQGDRAKYAYQRLKEWGYIQ